MDNHSRFYIPEETGDENNENKSKNMDGVDIGGGFLSASDGICLRQMADR